MPNQGRREAHFASGSARRHCAPTERLQSAENVFTQLSGSSLVASQCKSMAGPRR